MPLGTWWEEAAAPGPGFPSGIITRGLHIPERVGSPDPSRWTFPS